MSKFVRRFAGRRLLAIGLATVVPLAGAVGVNQFLSANAAAPLAISAPAQVGVGQSFPVRITGVPAGRYAAVTVGAETLGWAIADASGVATVTNAWWYAGEIAVTAKVDGTGPAVTTKVIVGIDTTTAPRTTAPTSTAPTTTTVPEKPRFTVAPRYVVPDPSGGAGSYVGYYYGPFPSAPDRSLTDFEVICDPGRDTQRVVDLTQPSPYCFALAEFHTIVVNDRRGIYQSETVRWGATTPGFAAEWPEGEKLTIFLGGGRYGLDPGASVSVVGGFGNWLCRELTCTSTEAAPADGASVPLPFKIIASFRSDGVVLSQEIRGVVVRSSKPTTTTTTEPPAGPISTTGQYIGDSQVPGLGLGVDYNPFHRYLVNPTAPNRTIDDFTVGCGASAKSQIPGLPGYTCLSTSNSLNDIVITDKLGQYAPLTVKWWSINPNPTFIRSGEKIVVDITATYGLTASEVSGATMENGTCVNGVCTANTPVYWAFKVPGKTNPPDFRYTFSFTARGVSGTGAVAGTVGARPITAPAQAVQGADFTLSWPGLAPGTEVSFLLPPDIVRPATADANGVATIQASLATLGDNTIRVGIGNLVRPVATTINVIAPPATTTPTTPPGVRPSIFFAVLSYGFSNEDVKAPWTPWFGGASVSNGSVTGTGRTFGVKAVLESPIASGGRNFAFNVPVTGATPYVTVQAYDASSRKLAELATPCLPQPSDPRLVCGIYPNGLNLPSGTVRVLVGLSATGPFEIQGPGGGFSTLITAPPTTPPATAPPTTAPPTTSPPTTTPTTTNPPTSGVIVEVPATVPLGTMFTAKATGLTPGSYAEFKIGSETLGWAKADGTGAAVVSTSWWTKGTFTLSVTEILANGTRAGSTSRSFEVVADTASTTSKPTSPPTTSLPAPSTTVPPAPTTTSPAFRDYGFSIGASGFNSRVGVDLWNSWFGGSSFVPTTGAVTGTEKFFGVKVILPSPIGAAGRTMTVFIPVDVQGSNNPQPTLYLQAFDSQWRKVGEQALPCVTTPGPLSNCGNFRQGGFLLPPGTVRVLVGLASTSPFRIENPGQGTSFE